MSDKKRITIGIFCGTLDTSYEIRIWSTILETARKKRINTLIFSGHALKSPFANESCHNFIYDLAQAPVLDGLILMSPTLTTHIKGDEYSRYLKNFSRIPLINLSFALPEHFTLLINNKKGMKDLIRHFIVFHKKRRLVFIKGPDNNPEANDRLEAYREVLSENGIPYDPELVLKGDSGSVWLRKAFRIFFPKKSLLIRSLPPMMSWLWKQSKP